MSRPDYGNPSNGKDSVTDYRNNSSKARTPMPREQRAKQFAPFDALTGLHARLAEAVEEHRKESEAAELIHVDIDEDEI